MPIACRPNNPSSMEAKIEVSIVHWLHYIFGVWRTTSGRTSTIMAMKSAAHMRMLILSVDKYGYKREN